MIDSNVQWLVGATASAGAAAVGAVVMVARLSFKLGTAIEQLSRIAGELTGVQTNAAKVPILEAEVVALRREQHECRERCSADLRELRANQSQPASNWRKAP